MPITVSEPDDPTLDPGAPRFFHPLISAFKLKDDGHYDYAVIAVQSAQEIYLELQVARLLEWRRLGSLGSTILDTLVRKYTFTDGRLQALWYALTGDDFRVKSWRRRLAWWTGYEKHMKLRHEIAHRGHRATKHDVERSQAAVVQALQYIQETTNCVGVDLGRMWEVGTPRPQWHDLPSHDRIS